MRRKVLRLLQAAAAACAFPHQTVSAITDTIAEPATTDTITAPISEAIIDTIAVPESVAPTVAGPVITDRIFMDVKIVNDMSALVLNDNVTKGRLVIGLYGNDAPVATDRFLKLIDGNIGTFKGGREDMADSDVGPKYDKSKFYKIEPGEQIVAGRIPSLRKQEFMGNETWMYDDRPIPELDQPIVEVNDLKHDRRGLLTIQRFQQKYQTEFGITLNSVPELDTTNVVIGIVEEGDDILAEMEKKPHTPTLKQPGDNALQALWTRAQRPILAIGQALGDEVEDHLGWMLTRIEIPQVGRL